MLKIKENMKNILNEMVGNVNKEGIRLLDDKEREKMKTKFIESFPIIEWVSLDLEKMNNKFVIHTMLVAIRWHRFLMIKNYIRRIQFIFSSRRPITI